MNYPSKTHQPPHVFIDQSTYFISARTYENKSFFSNIRKNELLLTIDKNFKEFNIKLFAFALLDNHYHLLFNIDSAKDISRIFKMIHGSLAYKWNKEDNSRGRTIFQNYWDYCIRDEKNFWTHLNYIHQNPIKHKLVKDLNELKKYEYCSYGKWLEAKGEKWMGECWGNYPVRDYVIQND